MELKHMEQDTLQQELDARIAALPQVVQDAITSADIEAHLRDLSKTHKLHLDQWELLENEVMMTLLGLDKPENLAANIEREVKMDHEAAVLLAADISRIVFEPIRTELESSLSSDNPKNAPSDMLSIQTTAPQPVVVPFVKPAPLAPIPEAPVTQAVRSDAHPNYTNTASHERKDVVGDPYREQPV
ncbi:MAG: hypothetical protein JWO50_407 [Candidatus Kaiserbacteria bacterium]|nr:hypothetical protein [Candidatus Kaiserbacteria bacterium]